MNLVGNALTDNAIQFLYISYDIYVALVSLVACLRPCNIDFHNETFFLISSETNSFCKLNAEK